MSEWLKEHAWKACVGETLPWVRIPLSPPLSCEWIQRKKVAQVVLRRRGFAPAAPPLRAHSRGPLSPAPVARRGRSRPRAIPDQVSRDQSSPRASRASEGSRTERDLAERFLRGTESRE